ncbi:MAG: hypothetical protein LUQ16_06405 [Methanomassiliicoccales archaeon]|nr:hypothetical protein [Methanomassiliicoccales archaeon]
MPLEKFSAEASIEYGLKLIAEQGILIETSRWGRIALVQGPENFSRVFIACDRAEMAYELLGTEYSRVNIGEPILIEASKAMVYDSIHTLLRHLTSPASEVREDPVLAELSAWIGQDEEAAEYIEAIMDSLSRSGFYEMMRLGLGEPSPQSSKAERLRTISEMAERDIAMFFSKSPPIDGLPSLLLSTLFPMEERARLTSILNSSPSALRALLQSKSARSTSLSLASLQQILPILSHLFAIFAAADPRRCDVKVRQGWRDELVAMVASAGPALRPTPILKVLASRFEVDIHAKEQSLS